MKARRSSIESWPIIRPCVKVGVSEKIVMALSEMDTMGSRAVSIV